MTPPTDRNVMTDLSILSHCPADVANVRNGYTLRGRSAADARAAMDRLVDAGLADVEGIHLALTSEGSRRLAALTAWELDRGGSWEGSEQELADAALTYLYDEDVVYELWWVDGPVSSVHASFGEALDAQRSGRDGYRASEKYVERVVRS